MPRRRGESPYRRVTPWVQNILTVSASDSEYGELHVEGQDLASAMSADAYECQRVACDVRVASTRWPIPDLEYVVTSALPLQVNAAAGPCEHPQRPVTNLRVYVVIGFIVTPRPE